MFKLFFFTDFFDKLLLNDLGRGNVERPSAFSSLAFDPYSIERQARMHRSAAGKRNVPSGRTLREGPFEILNLF